MIRGLRIATIVPLALAMTIAGANDCAAQAVRQKSEASREATPARIKHLIADLNADSRRVRLAAERALLDAGPRALPFLPPPELTPNVAVHEAVRRIRIRLESSKASESIQPSRVTLKGKHTLETVIKAITKQTGNRFDVSRLRESQRSQRIDCDFERRTFWSVIGDLEKQAGLRFEVDSQSDRLKPVTGKKPSTLSDTSAAFRIAVVSTRIKPLIGDDTRKLLRVNWRLTAEPRLRPLFLKYSGNAITAMSKGTQLKPFDPDARYELPLGEAGRGLLLRTDFVVPKNEIPKAIRLRGAISLLTAAGNEPIEFKRLAKSAGVAIRRGGVTVTLRKAAMLGTKQPGKKTVRVRVAVAYDVGGAAFESHRTWIFHNRVYVLNKNGKRFPQNGGFKTTLQDDGAVGVEYDFTVPEGTLSDYRFVYVAPTLLIDVPVKFDIAKFDIAKAAVGK